MTTITAAKSFTSRTLGALIIIAALTVGIGFGSLSNTPAPANAETITQPPATCLCTAVVGKGGEVPTRR